MFVKHKTKWKRWVVFGVGTVIQDYEGNIATLSEPDDYGNRRYKFKACGGYKKTEDDKWLRQDMWFGIRADNPLAQIVKNLAANDVVEVFGLLNKSKYKHPSTGELKNYYIVNLEKVSVLYRGDGTLGKDNDFSTIEKSDLSELDDDFSDCDF